MNRKTSIHSVFPCLNDEVELEPSVLGNKEISYDKRIKVTNWQDRYLIEPRDNTEFFPPKGHQRLATYKTFGTYGSQNYLSESREKFKSVDFKKCSMPVTMLNIFSFPLTDTGDDEKSRLEGEMKMYCIPENIPEISEELPDTLYRRTLGNSLEDIEKLDGMRTFLDDDLELHKKIADLKTKRYDR